MSVLFWLGVFGAVTYVAYRGFLIVLDRAEDAQAPTAAEHLLVTERFIESWNIITDAIKAKDEGNFPHILRSDLVGMKFELTALRMERETRHRPDETLNDLKQDIHTISGIHTRLVTAIDANDNDEEDAVIAAMPEKEKLALIEQIQSEIKKRRESSSVGE